MSLSICLVTADPPSRVAAILEPLRPLADEVLIAADSRVDEETLAGYAALADRLFKIEFCWPDRHLAWLFAQCRCDWILRVDGDEVPSQAFVQGLPDMLATRDALPLWAPNAWLFPDADRFLAGTPWSENFVVRLMRNDGTLRVSGVLHAHAEPVAPREYREEPFYHLDLLKTAEQDRLDKVVCYEASRPRLLAAGGGRLNEAFYLPELRDSLELRPVPAEDRPAITRALDGSSAPVSTVSVENVPFVSLEETDRMWEGAPSARMLTKRASSRASRPSRWLLPSGGMSFSGCATKAASAGPQRWRRGRRSGSPTAG